MILLLLLPVFLSCLLLAAHFLYRGQFILALGCLGMPALLLVRRGWAPRIMQGLLTFGAITWAWTARMLVIQRQELGRPWTRLAVILGAVALLTLLSAAVFQNRRIRDWYAAREDAPTSV